jgi:hypothetical protein
MNSDGSGDPQPVPTSDNLFKSAECWTREGLIFNDISGSTFRDLSIVAVDGDRKPRPLIKTQFTEIGARVAPDGRWVAYLSDEAGRTDVYIQSFPVLGHKVRVSTTGALSIWWMPGSDEVCFVSPGAGAMMSAKLHRVGNELEAETPRKMFELTGRGVGGDFSHDGQRLLGSVARPGAQQRRLRVVLDWTALLAR